MASPARHLFCHASASTSSVVRQSFLTASFSYSRISQKVGPSPLRIAIPSPRRCSQPSVLLLGLAGPPRRHSSAVHRPRSAVHPDVIAGRADPNANSTASTVSSGGGQKRNGAAGRGAEELNQSQEAGPPPPRQSGPAPGRNDRGSKRLRGWGIALAIAGTVWAVDEYVNARVLQRNALTAYTGLAIALDYKFRFDSSSEESAAALHERCAQRILRCCELNAGLYTKMGQAIGANAVVLPKPYHVLARMFDDAEKMPWTEVEQTVRNELGGRELEQVFDSFERTPIAAASVAQVHKAKLKDGRTVAVKVQRPQIRAQAYWDLLSFRIMLRFYERIFELPMSYFGQYISDQIELETHFLEEMSNCQRLKKAIAEDPVRLIRETVTVPTVYPELSTDRMLVMEFIDGAVRMTDREKIEGMGLSIKGVAQSVCEVFASMIFRYGLVQADGHAGNVLVRRHPDGKKGKHEVVLIDHGLCIDLRPEFRHEYAQLWESIFQLNLKRLEEICTGWGLAEGSSELMASATLMRPWRKPKTEEERKKAEEERKKDPRYEINQQKERIKNFLVHVEKVPEELIFVGRSMRIIQANNQQIGSPANRLNILARHAAAALISDDTPTLWRVFRPSPDSSLRDSRLGSRLSAYFWERIAFLRFRTTLLALDGAFAFSGLANWLSLLRHYPLAALGFKKAPPEARRGFEDDLERSMKAFAKEEMGVELTDEAFTG